MHDVARRIIHEGGSLTVDALRMAGVGEASISRTIVLDCASSVPIESFIPRGYLVSGEIVLVLHPASRVRRHQASTRGLLPAAVPAPVAGSPGRPRSHTPPGPAPGGR